RGVRGEGLGVSGDEGSGIGDAVGKQTLTPNPSPLAPGETGLRLAGALLWFWQTRGYITEGRERLAQLLALPGTEGSAARGHALIVAGRLAFLQGDYQSARASFSESLEIYKQLKDDLGAAHAMAGLGSAAAGQGDYASARTLFEESLATYRRANADKWNIAVALSGLGGAELRVGD